MEGKMRSDIKVAEEQLKHKKYCKVCGHTMSFYAFEPDRKVCSWCGYYNYRNRMVEFRYLLEKERKRIEYASSYKR